MFKKLKIFLLLFLFILLISCNLEKKVYKQYKNPYDKTELKHNSKF